MISQDTYQGAPEASMFSMIGADFLATGSFGILGIPTFGGEKLVEKWGFFVIVTGNAVPKISEYWSFCEGSLAVEVFLATLQLFFSWVAERKGSILGIWGLVSFTRDLRPLPLLLGPFPCGLVDCCRCLLAGTVSSSVSVSAPTTSLSSPSVWDDDWCALRSLYRVLASSISIDWSCITLFSAFSSAACSFMYCSTWEQLSRYI